MPDPESIAHEFMRRALAGHDADALKVWITSALAETGAPTWDARTAADALIPQPPLWYLVESLLTAPSLAIVYGGPGSLKSMVLADLAVAVASGSRWLDPLPHAPGTGVTLSTTQSPALWIDFDNGRRRTAIRLGAMLRGRSLGPDTPLHFLSMPDPHLDMSVEKHARFLGEYIQRGGYKLVVIDNLGLTLGAAEENSGAMAGIMGRYRTIAEDSGACILLVHHQRKSAVVAAANGVRKGETLRGHSSIEASLDLALLVEREPSSDGITLIPTKVRDFVPFPALGAKFTYEHASDSHDLASARFYSEATMTKEAIALAQLRATLQDIVRTEPGIVGKLLVDLARDRISVLSPPLAFGVNKVRGTIQQLVDDGIFQRSGNQSAFQYYLSRP